MDLFIYSLYLPFVNQIPVLLLKDRKRPQKHYHLHRTDFCLFTMVMYGSHWNLKNITRYTINMVLKQVSIVSISLFRVTYNY